MTILLPDEKQPEVSSVYSDVNPRYGRSLNPELVFDVDAINSSLENIILTIPGERVFLPQFGCEIHSLLHELMNERTARDILSVVVSAVEKWEPRIVVDFARSRVTPITDERVYEVYLAYIVVGLDIESSFQLRVPAG